MEQTERHDFNHDLGYYFSFFSSLLKKEGRRKGEWINENRDKKSCLSALSKLWNSNRSFYISFVALSFLCASFLS